MKTFILGLGHQKTGTSWLHAYLNSYSNFNAGITKEYHIWDALDIKCLSRNKINPPTNYIQSIRFKMQNVRFKMQNDKTFYFKYFNSLFSEKINLTSDITPSYSGLKKERLKFIKDSFIKKKINVKVIIFIRDPLARIKSATRYNLDRNNYDEGIKKDETNFVNALKQYYKNEHCIFRTHYHVTLENAFSVFNKENIFVGIYEKMFEPNEISKLSDFLNVDPKINFGKIRINQTKNKVTRTIIDDDIKKYYCDVYDYCFEKFPITKTLWDY